MAQPASLVRNDPPYARPSILLPHSFHGRETVLSRDVCTWFFLLWTSDSRGAGSGVETSKKMNAGANAKGPDGRKLFKLENETDVFAHDTVSSSLKKQIQSARLAKKMTQAQLAQAINEKPQIINEYESGKAIPNPQILSKMSRVLGVKLKKTG